MNQAKSFALFGILAVVTVGSSRVRITCAADGMPAALHGMPAAISTTASKIEHIVAAQQAMIEKARQSKTPEERDQVFQSIEANVRQIAAKRVTIMEYYTQLARKRVDWARHHASEVTVADLAEAMKQTSRPKPPRFPFAKASDRTDIKKHPKLPHTVMEARKRLEETMTRLQSLNDACTRAESDEQRRQIESKIAACLKTVEHERVNILEAVLKMSETRLQWARQRAAAAGSNAGNET